MSHQRLRGYWKDGSYTAYSSIHCDGPDCSKWVTGHRPTTIRRAIESTWFYVAKSNWFYYEGMDFCSEACSEAEYQIARSERLEKERVNRKYAEFRKSRQEKLGRLPSTGR